MRRPNQNKKLKKGTNSWPKIKELDVASWALMEHNIGPNPTQHFNLLLLGREYFNLLLVCELSC